MKINCTIDTEDMFRNEDEFVDFETLLQESFRRKVTIETKDKLGKDTFQKLAALTSDTIVAEIKLRMENFLSEEISLTEGWGKPTFVGSIEDLIKKRFDDVILRPVDSKGQTLKGCATDRQKTWIEWLIEEKLNKTVKDRVESAQRDIGYLLTKEMKAKIEEFKTGAIKAEVNKAFHEILTK